MAKAAVRMPGFLARSEVAQTKSRCARWRARSVCEGAEVDVEAEVEVEVP